MILGLLLLLGTSLAQQKAYPQKPIAILVPYGGDDICRPHRSIGRPLGTRDGATWLRSRAASSVSACMYVRSLATMSLPNTTPDNSGSRVARTSFMFGTSVL